ncbi:hypothetical protein ACGFNU_05895 [Spirillospora sp. NPDC048911]|uniref:hypothetical protein n=1 Tax=Spirillospora sp. NPDC048911 TaxID=3364527 RepID=UPI003715E30F
MNDDRESRHEKSGKVAGLRGVWRTAVPVAAAVGVALVVGGGVDLVHSRQDSDEPKPKSAKTKAVGKADTKGPRYVVGVRRNGTALIVRDIRSGDDVGLPVAAPQGQRFQRVASGGDGSYVAAAKTAKKVTFQRLSLEKNGHPKALAEIPRVAVTGTSTPWSDLAVAADGDKIAYVTYRGTRSRLDVISVETGARKTWTTKSAARLSSLSWAGDTLSFVWNPLRKVDGKMVEIRHQVRTLDTTGPAGDLGLSKAVLRLPKGSETAVLSQDGQTVVAGVTDQSQIALQAYSVETGQPTKVLWEKQVTGTGDLTGLDSDATGGHLLIRGGDGRLYVQGAPAVPAGDLADAAW